MPKDFAPVPLSELKTITNGEFYDDEFSKGRYSTDASIYQIKPLAVFIPKSKDDVIKAVNFCLNNNISILPRGGGTSQCGQTVNRSLVIDNSKYFNKIIDFDEKNKTCTVEPGIVLDEYLEISCNDKSIKVLEIQREGKRQQKIEEFVLGSKIIKGSNLNNA